MNKWCVAAIAALVLMTVALVFYRLRPKGNVDAVITSIENTMEESQQRANEIVSTTVKREVSARAEARKNTALLTDDELCDAINEMLRQYRASQQN